DRLDKLYKLKKGFLQFMFPEDDKAMYPRLRFADFSEDWEQRKLGEISTSYSGGTPTVNRAEYYKGSLPFIRSGEINKNKTELYITEKGLSNSSAKMVNIGDILYALYGATSGEVGISSINGAINQAILVIKPKDNYNSQFITQYLMMQKQKIISKYLQGGQGNLSGSILKKLTIMLPEYQEQNKYALFLKKLDTTIALHQIKIKKIQQIKKAYLQKMFI
ncbi:restriction endonuclease subunit S, partial [Dellaglioa algida]